MYIYIFNGVSASINTPINFRSMICSSWIQRDAQCRKQMPLAFQSPLPTPRNWWRSNQLIRDSLPVPYFSRQKTISGLPVRIALTSNPLSISLFSLFFVPSSWLRLLTLRSIHIEKPPEISISLHYLSKVRKNTQKFTYSSYSYPFAEASPLKISSSYISSFSWDFLKTLIASHDGPQKRLPFFSAVLAWTKLRRRLAWLSGLSIHSPHELAMIEPTL